MRTQDPLTTEDIERLKVLHAALDELAACFLARTERRPSSTSVMELMQWTNRQIDPSAPPPLTVSDLEAALHRWRDYEDHYILPCFRWAEECGLDLREAVASNPGKNCVELLVEWLRKQSGLDKPPTLGWIMVAGEGGNQYREATIGDFAGGDGVRFTMEYRATCYRRGPWWLLIEVAGGPNHHKWGCFDFADQPERHYHDERCLRREAELIANVLLHDRAKNGLNDG